MEVAEETEEIVRELLREFPDLTLDVAQDHVSRNDIEKVARNVLFSYKPERYFDDGLGDLGEAFAQEVNEEDDDTVRIIISRERADPGSIQPTIDQYFGGYISEDHTYNIETEDEYRYLAKIWSLDKQIAAMTSAQEFCLSRFYRFLLVLAICQKDNFQDYIPYLFCDLDAKINDKTITEEMNFMIWYLVKIHRAPKVLPAVMERLFIISQEQHARIGQQIWDTLPVEEQNKYLPRITELGIQFYDQMSERKEIGSEFAADQLYLYPNTFFPNAIEDNEDGFLLAAEWNLVPFLELIAPTLTEPVPSKVLGRAIKAKAYQAIDWLLRNRVSKLSARLIWKFELKTKWLQLIDADHNLKISFQKADIPLTVTTV